MSRCAQRFLPFD